MARPARSRAQQPLYDDDSDSDNRGGENSDYDATPKASRKAIKAKKRVSDAFHTSGGTLVGIGDSSSGSPTRIPLMAVNINDDDAEKRKRRKSAKMAQPMMTLEPEPAADAGPSSSPRAAGRPGDTPKTIRHQRQKQQLMTVAETPMINVPLDVMSSNFEEWMKMATDNKINAANSWNFALIDYFHDMSLLRNNVDNSINFQKASCTLDGCVKIWTSRVDSVGTETGKLLSNLANEGKGDDDEDDVLSDNVDAADPMQRAKRANKASRQESTLAKNAAQLKSKKLDLEFSVDPLFKKTCADFDEGGAQGLLMNHLSLGVGSEGSMRVIFDASDSMGKGKDDEEEDLDEPPEEIDLSFLRNEFLPILEAIEDKAISHSLDGFSFAKDAFSFDSSNFMNATYLDDGHDDDDDGDLGDDANAQMDVDGGADGGDVQDFFVGDQAVGDDFGGDVGMGDAINSVDGDGNATGENGASTQQPTRRGGFEPFDPRHMPNERDLILAMTEPGAEGSSLDYFDQTFMKNWAGPEHWKLRKVIRRPDVSVDTTANKTRREKKEPFKIDFLTPSAKPQKEIIKELFAPVTRGGSLTLPLFSKSSRKGRKSKETQRRSEHTLPDDMHFSSRQLVTLFLKPKFALKMRGHRARLNERDGEVDEHFWAQAAADQAAGRRNEDGDEVGNEGAIPFNTQFFHDEYDDGPGFDDIYDGDGDGPISRGGEGGSMENGDRDLLSETQGLGRRIRPETVNYAKRAKRVDVRKLKENIWKGLDIVVPKSQGTQDGDGDEFVVNMPDNCQATDPSEPRTFTTVVTGLQNSYPKDKMDEISTSFCFICLLHLANEQGLKLEVGESDEMADEVDDRKVGHIYGLKIYRDPTAIPSA